MALLGPEREPKFTERDVILGTAIASGATVKEAAEAIGVHERTCYKFLERDEQIIHEVKNLVRPFVKPTRREIKQVAIEQVTEEFNQKIGKALAALDTALESDDPRTALEAAKETFNRILGKPTANVNVSGGVRHEHVAIIPSETLAALNGVIASSRALYSDAKAMLPPSQAVIDA